MACYLGEVEQGGGLRGAAREGSRAGQARARARARAKAGILNLWNNYSQKNRPCITYIS